MPGCRPHAGGGARRCIWMCLSWRQAVGIDRAAASAQIKSGSPSIEQRSPLHESNSPRGAKLKFCRRRRLSKKRGTTNRILGARATHCVPGAQKSLITTARGRFNGGRRGGQAELTAAPERRHHRRRKSTKPLSREARRARKRPRSFAAGPFKSRRPMVGHINAPSGRHRTRAR